MKSDSLQEVLKKLEEAGLRNASNSVIPVTERFGASTDGSTIEGGSRASLEDVIKTLEAFRDEVQAGMVRWENPTLEQFLEGMRAWLQSISKDGGVVASWDLMVCLLEAGKGYE